MCMRSYIVIPDTRATRTFAIVFDVIITKSFFRNHIILMFCSAQGFQQSYFFTLMLLDVFSISEGESVAAVVTFYSTRS